MPETSSITEGHIDWKEVSDKLQNLLRLRTLPVGWLASERMKVSQTLTTWPKLKPSQLPWVGKHLSTSMVTCTLSIWANNNGISSTRSCLGA